MPFLLWPEQKRVLEFMQTESLLVILKARQLGISWLACLYALWLCMYRANNTVLVFSTGQNEANELSRRIVFMYTQHNQKDTLPVIVKNNTEETVWGNGSRVLSLPATKRAGRSFAASLIILDEFAFMLFGADLYTAAKPTIDDGGKMFVISSADGNGTLYHRFWKAAQAGRNSFTPVFLPWQSNPKRVANWREQKLIESFGDSALVKREYPENDIEAFVNASGLVFDVWSDGPADGNVTEAAEYQADAGDVLWVVDDGYAGQIDPHTGEFTADSHPRAILLVQMKPDGHLDIFAESYAVKKLSDVHISEVKSLGYPDPLYAIIGPGFAELAGRLHAAGIYTRGVHKEVDETIKVARRMLAPDANGWRRIRVHTRCRHLRSEMVSYRRDPTTGKVIKEHDHGPDGIRYLAWERRHG